MNTSKSREARPAELAGVVVGPQALWLLGSLIGAAAGIPGCALNGLCVDEWLPLVDQTVMVARWRHEPVLDGRVFGVDIDGRVSDRGGPGCNDAEDFSSRRSGYAGVDNQYARNLLWLIEPRSYPPPDRLGRHIFETQLVAGVGLVGFEVDVEPAPPGSTSGWRVFVTLLELTPTAPLRVAFDGLATGARVVPTRIETVEARFENWRRTCDGESFGSLLRVTFSTMRIPMGTVDGIQPIEDATVLLDIDRAGRLGVGELGAAVSVATVLEVARNHSTTVDEPTIRELGHPDLDPDVTGVCQRFSFGVGLDLAPVELVETP